MSEVAYGLPSVMPDPPAGPRMTAPPPPGRGSRLRERIPVTDGRWWERAACRGLGRDAGSVWHEPWHHPSKVVHEAIAMCRACPVLSECAAEQVGAPGLKAGHVWVTNHNGRQVRQTAKTCGWCRRVFYGISPKARCCSTSCRTKLGVFEAKGAKGVAALREAPR